MTPELQAQLAEMLKKLTDVAGDATAFAKEQIPPLVAEKIALGRAEISCYMAFGAIIALALIWLCIKYWTRAWKSTVENDAPVIGLNIAGLFAAFFCLGVNLHDFLLVWFAPRLYIVEWLKSMVTK